MPSVVADLLDPAPPTFQLYVDAPEAVRLMEVVAQVSIPLVGVTPTVGAVVLLLMVAEAVPIHPFEAFVPVTV